MELELYYTELFVALTKLRHINLYSGGRRRQTQRQRQRQRQRLFISFILWNRKLKEESKSSRGSLCTRKMEDSCVDFISELPDHLLLHIFSFLDETAVFQSSVLSRRWQHLLTMIPFPVHIIEMRNYFKKQKTDIRKKKLIQEEVAGKNFSELLDSIGVGIIMHFLTSFSCTAGELKMFVVINPLLTLMFMALIYCFCSKYHSMMCADEAILKRIQRRDSRLTSTANSPSTTNIPMMELLFPENYKPRNPNSAKVYGLIGILLLIIVSVIFKWKFGFLHELHEYIQKQQTQASNIVTREGSDYYSN